MLFLTCLRRVVPWIKYKNGFWFLLLLCFTFINIKGFAVSSGWSGHPGGHSLPCSVLCVLGPPVPMGGTARIPLLLRPLASTCVGQTWGSPCASLVWAKSMFLYRKPQLGAGGLSLVSPAFIRFQQHRPLAPLGLRVVTLPPAARPGVHHPCEFPWPCPHPWRSL